MRVLTISCFWMRLRLVCSWCALCCCHGIANFRGFPGRAPIHVPAQNWSEVQDRGLRPQISSAGVRFQATPASEGTFAASIVTHAEFEKFAGTERTRSQDRADRRADWSNMRGGTKDSDVTPRVGDAVQPERGKTDTSVEVGGDSMRHTGLDEIAESPKKWTELSLARRFVDTGVAIGLIEPPLSVVEETKDIVMAGPNGAVLTENWISGPQYTTFLLVCVSLRPGSVIWRESIRASWKHGLDKLSEKVEMLFFVGTSESERTADYLAKERDLNKDIIQIWAHDDAHATEKTLEILRWVGFNRKAKYVMKVEADAYPNLPRLLTILKADTAKLSVHGNIVTCAPVHNSVVHSPDGRNNYTQHFYPKYVQGSAFVMSWGVVIDVGVARYQDHRFTWLEGEVDKTIGFWLRRDQTMDMSLRDVKFIQVPSTLLGCSSGDVISMNLQRQALICMWKKATAGFGDICCPEYADMQIGSLLQTESVYSHPGAKRADVLARSAAGVRAKELLDQTRRMRETVVRERELLRTRHRCFDAQ